MPNDYLRDVVRGLTPSGTGGPRRPVPSSIWEGIGSAGSSSSSSSSSSARSSRTKKKESFWDKPWDVLNAVLYVADLPRATVASGIKELGDLTGFYRQVPDGYDPKSKSFEGRAEAWKSAPKQDASWSDLWHQIVNQDKRVYGSDLLFGNDKTLTMPFKYYSTNDLYGESQGVGDGKIGTASTEFSPVGKATIGIIGDVSIDPLTAVHGSELAREGTKGIAEVAATNTFRRAATAAAESAAANPELGDDVAQTILDAIERLRSSRPEDTASVVGDAIQVARESGDAAVVAEFERGADVVSRASRFGLSGLDNAEIADYLVDDAGSVLGSRGLQFRLPTGRDVLIPGTDSAAGRAVGEGIARAKNRMAIGLNSSIGRVLNAESELTRMARQGVGDDALRATATRMAGRTARSAMAVRNTERALQAAQALEGTSEQARRWAFRLLEGGGENVADTARFTAAEQVEGQRIADALRPLMDSMGAEARAAGANINILDAYIPRNLTEEGRQILNDVADALNLRTFGQNPIRQSFERARVLIPDADGVSYTFLGERFLAANNAEVRFNVTEIARKRLLEAARATTGQAARDMRQAARNLEGFFNADLQEVIQNYIRHSGRRIAQMNVATRLYGFGIGQVQRENLAARAATAREVADAAPDALTPQHLLDMELDRLVRQRVRGEARQRMAAAAAAAMVTDDLSSMAGAGRAAGSVGREFDRLFTDLRAEWDDLSAADAAANADRMGVVEQMIRHSDQGRRSADLLDEAADARQVARDEWARLDSVPEDARDEAWATAFEAATEELAGHEEWVQHYALHVLHNQQQLYLLGNDIPDLSAASWSSLIRDRSDTIVAHTIAEATRQVRHGIGTPTELVDMMVAVNRISNPEGLRSVLHAFDEGVGFVKQYQIATPGFHMRNAIGAIWTNAALGGMRPGSWRGYRQLVRAEENGTITAAEADLLRQCRIASGGGGLVRGEGYRGLGGFEEFGIESRPDSRVRRVLEDNFWLRSSRRAGASIEANVRGALAYDVITRGGTVDDAVRKVVRLHFDYSSDALTKFEQGVRHVMPFYTWTRFNLPLQIEMLSHNPKAYARIAQLRAEVESMSMPDGLVPAYFRKLGPAIRLPLGAPGGGGHLYLTPDLPSRDLGRIELNPKKFVPSMVREAASMVSPVGKAPLELWAGKQFFNDIPLRDDRAVPLPWPSRFTQFMEGPLKLLWGDRLTKGPDGKLYTTEKNAYLITQYLPVLGILQRLAPQEDKYRERNLASWLSFFGLGVRTNSLEEQRRLLRGEQIRSSNERQQDRRFRRSVVRGGR